MYGLTPSGELTVGIMLFLFGVPRVVGLLAGLPLLYYITGKKGPDGTTKKFRPIFAVMFSVTTQFVIIGMGAFIGGIISLIGKGQINDINMYSVNMSIVFSFPLAVMMYFRACTIAEKSKLAGLALLPLLVLLYVLFFCSSMEDINLYVTTVSVIIAAIITYFNNKKIEKLLSAPKDADKQKQS